MQLGSRAVCIAVVLCALHTGLAVPLLLAWRTCCQPLPARQLVHKKAGAVGQPASAGTILCRDIFFCVRVDKVEAEMVEQQTLMDCGGFQITKGLLAILVSMAQLLSTPLPARQLVHRTCWHYGPACRCR
jgi:hypothetical protein